MGYVHQPIGPVPIFIDVTNPGYGLAAATGDGVTDDTANLRLISEWLRDNGGGKGEMYFPDGTYICKRIDANIWGMKCYPGVTYTGQSRAGTIIKRAPQDAGAWRGEERVWLAGYEAYTSDTAVVKIRNFTFDGNNHSTTGGGTEFEPLLYLGAIPDSTHRGYLMVEVDNLKFQNEQEASGLFVTSNVNITANNIVSDQETGGTEHCIIALQSGNIIFNGTNLDHKNIASFWEGSEGGKGWDPVLGETYRVQLTLDGMTFDYGTTISIGFESWINNESTLTANNLQGGSPLFVGWTDSVFNITNSTFYQNNDQWCYNPGTMNVTNCNLYCTSIAEIDVVRCFPYFNFKFASNPGANQVVTFTDCTFDSDNTPSAGMVRAGVLVASTVDPTAGTSITFDTCVFTNNIHYSYWASDSYTGGVIVFRDCTFNNDAVGAISWVWGGSVDKYPIRIVGNNSGLYMDLTIQDCTWNAARFCTFAAGTQNVLRISGVTLTEAQNIISAPGGFGGRFFRPDGQPGVMRTITGTNDPTVTRPAGFCGTGTYDRYVRNGTTNYKCTTAGLAGVAVWALE